MHPHIPRSVSSSVLLAVASLSVVLTTGCALQTTATPAPQSFGVSGTVMGGALPVSGSHIYLYAANTNGNAGPGLPATGTNASISLLKPAGTATAVDVNGNYYVTAGTTGQFNLANDYTACTTGQQLYIYGTGGNGTGAGSLNNAAIGLLASLGTCGSTPTKIILNEMSTVAAAYSLAGFATDATHIADDETLSGNTTQSYAKTGMANAFSNPANLVNLGSLRATTSAGNGTLPTATINTIANILAGCVQATASSNKRCTDLFTFTGTASTADTATATINLAHHPAGVSGSSVTLATLFADIEPQTSFSPNLTHAPNDFTLAVTYPTGTTPNGLAIDGSGNVWVSNTLGTSPAYTGSAQQFTAPTYTLNQTVTSGVSQPGLITIDLNQTVWATEGAAASVIRLVPSGTSSTVTKFGYTGNGTLYPSGIAIDSANNVWIADNTSGKAIAFTNQGAFKSQTAAVLNSPVVLAIDPSNDLFFGQNSRSALAELPAPGYATTNFSDSSLGGITANAIDVNGSIWATGGSPDFAVFQKTSTSYTESSFPTSYNSSTGNYTPGIGGAVTPDSVAIDGSSNIWLGDYNNGNGGFLVELTDGAVGISPSTGYTSTTGTTGGIAGPYSYPLAVAVDGSGNVWTTDNSNILIELIGAATPVVTPLAAGIAASKLGSRP